MDAKGKCVSGFEAVQRAFEEIFDDPQERGGGVCVQVAGETVVDLWAGVADLEGSKPWNHDTLVNSYCSIKPFAAVAALMLVEEGKLELDAPIARYWPEFAQSSKDRVTLRQVLCHTAGVSGLRLPDHSDIMYDWEAMIGVMAAEPLWWEPGSDLGYGAWTFGWIVGEVIRRVDGRDPTTFIAERISRPNGLDVHMGVAEEDFYRIAYFSHAQGRVGDQFAQDLRNVILFEPEHVAALTFTNPPCSPRQTSDPRWWALRHPGLNSHSTAHGLAGFYSALLGGRLIGPELLKEFYREQSKRMDRTLLRPMRYGLGCMMEHPDDPSASYCMGPNAFGHVGLGGPVSFADPDSDVTFGFVTNTMGSHVLMDPRARKLATLAYAAL